MNPLDIFICFYQIISLLSHTDFTKLTKTASQKARSCRLCRVPTNRMASTSVASALREICVKINHLTEEKRAVFIMRIPCWREIGASHPYRTHLWRPLGLSYAVSATKGMVYNHIPLSGGHWQIETGKAFSAITSPHPDSRDHPRESALRAGPPHRSPYRAIRHGKDIQ